MKYRVSTAILVAVHTIVEADDEDAAIDIANERKISKPIPDTHAEASEWVLSRGADWNSSWGCRPTHAEEER